VNIVVVAYNDNYDSSTQTAADGTYSISVAPGSYTLNFHKLLNDQTYAAGYYSTAGFTYYQSKASLVTVGTVNVTGKNVTLPFSIFISGTVTDSAAQTLDGIDVYADSTGLLDYSGYFSTEDGLYEVSVAPSTSYTLDFVDEGGTYASGYYTTSTTSKFTYDYSAATSVAVASADVGNIDIALPPAIHIAGTVTDPSAAPLSNIEVDLNSTSSNAIRGARPSGTTDGGALLRRWQRDLRQRLLHHDHPIQLHLRPGLGEHRDRPLSRHDRRCDAPAGGPHYGQGDQQRRDRPVEHRCLRRLCRRQLPVRRYADRRGRRLLGRGFPRRLHRHLFRLHRNLRQWFLHHVHTIWLHV
jgi:hypothetical protein